MKVELTDSFIESIRKWNEHYKGTEQDHLTAVSHLTHIIDEINEQESRNAQESEDHIQDLIDSIN